MKNEKGNAPSSCRGVLTGIRFFYQNILEKELTVAFSQGQKPRRLPTVLTKQQVAKIINSPKNLKHRLLLMTTYAAGLTVATKKEPTSVEQMMLKLTGVDITTCPCCQKGKMRLVEQIPKYRARPPNPLAFKAA